MSRNVIAVLIYDRHQLLEVFVDVFVTRMEGKIII
jgi:hypothetical protein